MGIFRFVLSIIVIFAFAGASAASVLHGLHHGPHQHDHHAEMAASDPVAEAEQALEDCCGANGSMNGKSCLGDLVVANGMSPSSQTTVMTSSQSYINTTLAGLELSVPTGPPKI